MLIKALCDYYDMLSAARKGTSGRIFEGKDTL